MWSRVFHGSALVLLLAGSAAADTTIDFDDILGMGGPFTSCPSQYQVDDEYLAFGVRFASTDPAVCVLAPSNPSSPPNVVAGLSAGNIAFGAPIITSFFDGAQPRAVASVTLEVTPGASSETTVEAYDVNGVLLGSSGNTGSGTHVLTFPQRIHSVRVDHGTFAVDDLSFTPLGPPPAVPALPLALRVLLAALLAAVGLRVLRRAR